MAFSFKKTFKLKNILIVSFPVLVIGVAIYIVFGGGRGKEEASFSKTDLGLPTTESRKTPSAALTEAEQNNPDFLEAVENKVNQEVAEAIEQGESFVLPAFDAKQEEESVVENPLLEDSLKTSSAPAMQNQYNQFGQGASNRNNNRNNENLQLLTPEQIAEQRHKEKVLEAFSAILDKRSDLNKPLAISAPSLTANNATWQEHLSVTNIYGGRTSATGARNANNGGVNNGTNNQEQLAPIGKALYATLSFGLRSDISTPVMAQIWTAPFFGWVATGNFQAGQDSRIRLAFNSITSPEGETLSIQSIAVGAEDNVMLDGNLEWNFMGKLLLVGSTFAEGAADAMAKGTDTIIPSETDTLVEESEPTVEEAMFAGLADGLEEFNEGLKRQVSASEYRDFERGTQIAIVLTSPIFEAQPFDQSLEANREDVRNEQGNRGDGRGNGNEIDDGTSSLDVQNMIRELSGQ